MTAEAVGSLTHLEEVESGRVNRRVAEVRDLLRSVKAVSARDAVDELSEFTRSKGAV